MPNEIVKPVVTTSRSAAFLLVTVLAWNVQAQESAELDLGTIDFPTSASGEVQQEFLTGALALHSFWYEEARDHFRRARELDPSFAMAYWGEAMTHDHPLWEQHDGRQGKAVLKELRRQDEVRWTERERAYVDAVRVLFEHRGDIDDRRRSYARVMQELADRFPEDTEAAVFAALAQMSLPDFDGNDVSDVVPVAAVLEEVYKHRPSHPGAIHYLIHVYDAESFAPLGLRPARDYARTAPASSHALHMPSHIFKDLEMWEEMAASNVDAYQASVDWQERTDRPLRMRDYHALTWLFDAYIKLERFDEARILVRDLEEVEAEARRRDESLGRIPSTLEYFRQELEKIAGS